MPLVDDHKTVEEFATDGADEAFGDRVRSRRPHRRPYDSDVDGCEHGVEAGGELAVAVADEESEASVGVVEVHQQVARLLGQPRSGGVRGDAQDVHAAGAVFDDEERVEPVQGDRVEVEQVAGQNRLGLRLEKLRPGRTGPPGCGIDSGRAEDFPCGGGADLVAESGEFAVDAPIPPGGILVARRTVRARTPAGMVGRPARMGGVVQRRRTRCRCQRRIVAGVTTNPWRRRAGSSPARVAITARSVQLICGWRVRRWRTAS